MSEQIKVLKYYLYYKYFLRINSRKGLMRRQERRIKKHLRYVAQYSQIYKGKDQLKDYPVSDKEFMMRHFKELNTVGIGWEEAEQFAVKAERVRDFVPKLHGVTVGLSSGTSGRQGIFLVSDEERVRWAGYILAKFLPGPIWEKCSIGFFMRADSNLYQSVGSKQIQFHFFDIYQDMSEHREKLEKINPRVLAGQPSVLLEIAREVECGHIRIRPEVVISIAEVLEKGDEERLKQVFERKVIHQVYQCTEGCLAVTCKYGTLHLNEDIVHIEKEYLDDNRFVPVVTDFERKAQPIIRYRLNDILVEKKEGCCCKSPCIALEKIEGREDDVFVFEGKDGEIKKVFPDFIRRCVLFAEDEKVVEERNGSVQRLEGAKKKIGKERVRNVVREYRVVQETDGKITIYADLTEEGKQQVEAEFEQMAKDRGFVMPELVFEVYRCERGRKMKRVERKGSMQEKNKRNKIAD